MIFDWMPLIFTFMLASFSAGLVIYWAWNNTLSVLQQSVIMRKHGANIELWDNIKELFGVKKPAAVKEEKVAIALSPSFRTARSADPEFRNELRACIWIPGSPLRGAPE